MDQGDPLAVTDVEADSWTRSPAASSLVSADSSIWGVVGLSGAASEVAVSCEGAVDGPHAPKAPKVGFAGSDAHATRPSGKPATPLSGVITPPKEQLAPKPEFGHGCDPFGISTWARSSTGDWEPLIGKVDAATDVDPIAVAITWIEIEITASTTAPFQRDFRPRGSKRVETVCNETLPRMRIPHSVRTD
jgi:hypothetical protein